MKTYIGTKGTGSNPWPGIVKVLETVPDGPDREYALPHHVYHSPDGFSWGYGGSGPSELARCILLDHFDVEGFDVKGTDVPPSLYHAFVEHYVSRWQERWVINTDEIGEWLNALEAESRDAERVTFPPHRQVSLAEARADIEETQKALAGVDDPHTRAVFATILRVLSELTDAIQAPRNDGVSDEPYAEAGMPGGQGE